MLKPTSLFVLGAVLLTPLVSARAQQSQQPLRTPLESLRNDVPAPVILCIDDIPGTGGQPSAQAYAKAATSGFRSVLTLRAKNDRVDVSRERLIAEQNKLRYFYLPAGAQFPDRAQVDEFLRLATDPANQPMLVNCAFAERVAPLMMMFRIIEQGWSEDRAIDEASRSGISKARLKKFAGEYLAGRNSLRTKSTSSGPVSINR